MERGLDFFDTTVLVASSIQNHPHYPESSACLSRLRETGGACAAHTLAESYNTLTRTSKGYGLPPLAAAAIVKEAREWFTLLSLTPDETLSTIHAIAERGLPGALVYDALILACARKIDARHIYTNNLKHFRQVAPDLASRIVEPWRYPDQVHSR